MNENSLLSEKDSAAIAGVTIETLKRYSELGLLSPENSENEVHYRESDIRTLFYTKFKSASEPSPEAPAPLVEQITVAKVDTSNLFSTTSEPDPFLMNVRNWPNENEIESRSEPEVNVQPPHQTAQQTISNSSYQELVEINRGLREQIDLLREERSWLRERVERLESQSERNQMLLLRESENVRSLVNQQQRRGFFGLALPWFGPRVGSQKE